MKRNSRADNYICAGLIIAILCYGIACAYLYYNQIFWETTGRFESDLPFHISMVVKDGWFYSLTGLVYLLFFSLPGAELFVAGFLSLLSLGSIYATSLLIDALTEKFYAKGMVLLFAVISNFLMPFYLSFAGKQRYIGYQSPSVWHNSTYICMKFLGILTVWYFVKLRKKYKEGLKFREWLILAILFGLCNMAKPSFVLAFAPVFAIMLFWNLCVNKDKPLRTRFLRAVVFGSSVLPSLLVVLWQNAVLFGDDTGNGIVIRPGYALAMRGDHPKITFILSIAFPLVVLACNFKDLLWDKRYRFAWGIWLVSFLEVFLLCEEGNRALDSNFFWGYSIGIFFVNLMSMIKMLEKMKDEEKETSIFRIVATSVGTLFLAYEFYCGLYFFCELLKGTSYWM